MYQASIGGMNFQGMYLYAYLGKSIMCIWENPKNVKNRPESGQTVRRKERTPIQGTTCV
jgi:hypothetical protein